MEKRYDVVDLFGLGDQVVDWHLTRGDAEAHRRSILSVTRARPDGQRETCVDPDDIVIVERDL